MWSLYPIIMVRRVRQCKIILSNAGMVALFFSSTNSSKSVGFFARIDRHRHSVIFRVQLNHVVGKFIRVLGTSPGFRSIFHLRLLHHPDGSIYCRCSQHDLASLQEIAIFYYDQRDLILILTRHMRYLNSEHHVAQRLHDLSP